MIGPEASASGFAFWSTSMSATSRIFSSKSSRPSFCFAETSANCVVRPSPPAAAPRRRGRPSRGRRSRREIHFVHGDDDRHFGRARVRDRLARLRITLSSAATTSTAMSVIFAPRARIAVKASWPGVSRKVILRLLWSTW